MKKSKLEIFDPAMCCSTGVCGPSVDPKLVQFSADLKWLQDQGIEVRRFNLAQEPMAFVQNELVNAALTNEGALPMLLVEGCVVSSGSYPERSELAQWLGISEQPASACCGGNDEEEKPSSCCGSSGCCQVD